MVPLAKTASLLVLAAAGEKSKTPFYIAGSALAAWAVVVSAMGLRRAEFPRSPRAARAVMGISATLVATAIAMALVTASRPKKGAEASAAAPGAPAPPGPGAKPAGGGPAASASTVTLAADPSGQLRYDKSSLKAHPGQVTIAFTNQSQLPHNVTLEAAGKTVGATSTVTGSSTKVTVPLAPGTYTYYCSVDAHRQMGMQGTLTVG